MTGGPRSKVVILSMVAVMWLYHLATVWECSSNDGILCQLLKTGDIYYDTTDLSVRGNSTVHQ